MTQREPGFRIQGRKAVPNPPQTPPPESPGRVQSFDFLDQHPSSIVLHCSDGRFTRPVEALMLECGFQRYDTVAMPGGPALLDMSSSEISRAEATRASLSFLIRKHKTATAVLVAHAGCGYYQDRYGGQPDQVVWNHQARDLQAAAAWLRKAHPQVAVKLCIAFVRNNQVVFQPLEVDPTAVTLL